MSEAVTIGREDVGEINDPVNRPLTLEELQVAYEDERRTNAAQQQQIERLSHKVNTMAERQRAIQEASNQAIAAARSERDQAAQAAAQQQRELDARQAEQERQLANLCLGEERLRSFQLARENAALRARVAQIEAAMAEAQSA